MSQVTTTALLENPLLPVSLQGVQMKISTQSQLKPSIVGYFYCIDPASGTIALLTPNESIPTQISKIELVFSHSIVKIEFDSDKILSRESIALIVAALKPKSGAALSPEDLASCRKELLKILEITQLPYEESEDGKFTVASVAVISPPYSHRDIKCSNVIVFKKLKELLGQKETVD